MSYIKNSSKKVIVSVVMALMMVLAMMPGMAFADTAAVTINNPTAEIVVGAPYTMTAEYTATNAHIDWSVTNGTGAATISKHKGQLTPSSAGTVTVTATLISGTATGGTGGGNGSGGNTQCEGTVLGTATKEVTVKATSGYGYQGLSGNTLKLLSPENAITLGNPATDTTTVGGTTYTVYKNQISGHVALNDNDIAEFGYTMSAGVNNFKYDPTFVFYQDEINVLDASRQVVASVANDKLAYNGFDTTNKMIKLNVSGLESGETYILQFGPKVCGNNTSKKLGCYIEFNFTVE